MADFFIITHRKKRGGPTEIYPKFIICKSSDLMIRGGDFYAVWLEDRGFWSTDEQDAIRLIDNAIEEELRHYKGLNVNEEVVPKYLWDASSGMIDVWHKYCQKQMRENYHMLDEKLIFSNDGTNKKDYASKRLDYPLAEGDISAYDKIISTLYSEEERHKIEWAIGAIVSGDSKTLQKFMVFYGSAGTGKSTIINIIQKLFEGYYAIFDAKALGSASASFALEPFRTNPLVAIQHDGDLSKIEDNTRLNSLVSHEEMTINEKFKATYTNKFKAFLIMGTNKPVKITDAKSGLIRRLIDVIPSGNKIPLNEYNDLIKKVDFELGAIAYHCLQVYLSDPHRYDDYVPVLMLGATNDFYNFVEDSYYIFKDAEIITAKQAWAMYKEYCEDANVKYLQTRKAFVNELRNYFEEYHEHYEGVNTRGVFKGFLADKFHQVTSKKIEEPNQSSTWLIFKEQPSIFDQSCSHWIAQYATSKGTPRKKWDKVTTTLSDLDTHQLHYVKMPDGQENHIFIDFDIPDEDGNKCLERNLEAASKFPPTYAELSKSGAGIHLHYIYNGDPARLSRVFGDHIEIKVFTGKSSLRRQLTKCNDLPIAVISSGLPVKGVGKVVNFDAIKSEKALKTMIKKNLNKEYHPGTKPSVDFIFKILEDAYESGLKYDVTDLRNAVLGFAANSTHQADYCIKLVNKMKFKSEEPSEQIVNDDQPIVFYDVEVFPNLFLVNWKYQGPDKQMVRMINPRPEEIEDLLKFRLVGFNCRRYDNHILYARYMGYTNEQLFNLSQRIIVEKDRDAFFGEAYNISYTDIYDYAAKKQSLKKWEIELGIHHQELGLPWDQPVPEEKWVQVAEYCDNDVYATEAVWNATQGDFLARQILADLADGSVNDTTNSLTTKIIFGKERNPQKEFNYRDLGEVCNDDYIPDGFDEYTRFNKKGQPVFPGYEFEAGKSTYRGEKIGEGGRVYAEPGMYGMVALLDVASMHPTSAIMEELFGKYTKRFKDIKDARVYIKHEDWDSLKHILDGKLMPYVKKIQDGLLKAKSLAQALKIAINSVYGLTSASFMNAFRDSRNIDNIVAKRGALFMENLRHEVEKRGFIVAHIKTDSIKIPDATLEIIQFVMEYGKMYGYDFEHEATYERMCLVNDAVYIAKFADAETCEKLYGYAPGECVEDGGKWTATGTQFQVPYVFKKLFSKEDITFDDLCETKSVSKGTLYLDMNEDMEKRILDTQTELKRTEREYRRLLRTEPNNTSKLNDYENGIDSLNQQLEEAHNYIFVGRVGQFCPIKPGYNGGLLYREQDGKYYAAAGTKGYRWLESEVVKNLNNDAIIDRSYYDHLVDEAAESISFYGDLEWFISDDPYQLPNYEEGKPVYLDFGSKS